MANWRAGRDGKHIPGESSAIRILHGQHRPAAGGKGQPQATRRSRLGQCRTADADLPLGSPAMRLHLHGDGYPVEEAPLTDCRNLPKKRGKPIRTAGMDSTTAVWLDPAACRFKVKTFAPCGTQNEVTPNAVLQINCGNH
ncbi:MAG: hypothetical protein PHG39_12720 [Acidithiobacillus ferrooxidans]|nr:hypothetical protein [Acidithiobacillus ferrooxidans]MDD5004071.1 hypothetical protein [Acidithiobacillus sp.]MDD5379168.1 hypothetical protein [Acidithiobacillus sp.]MDD5577568.1 hypothetical protein [Acidithiobacillus sp.]